MDIQTKNRQAYDVIVVGGGVAGVAAAVAAARNGSKTLLLEKSCMLGGLATLGLISWYEPLCDGEGKQMIAGISEELIRLSIKYGFENMPKNWGGIGAHYCRYDRFATYYSPNIFAVALIEYLEENGVELLLDTLATFPEMKDGRCTGVLVETVAGREFFPAKFVIDATGTAEICRRAGIPSELGENFFTYITHELDKEGADKLAETGDFCTARRWRNVGSDLRGNGHPEGMAKLTSETAEDVTEYMVIGAKKLMARLKNEDKESRDIMTLPGMPQYRTIRRIIGEYEFDGTEVDVRFEDSVGSFADFRARGRRFHLPYKTLYNKKVPNVYAVGRIISSKEDGWELTRVIPVCALSGEAAGTAAALCVKTGADAATLDIGLLQKTMREAGNLFE